MVAKQPHFSPKQIADALQASESSVKRWCDRGAIPTIRTVGGHRRITLDALQSFLRNSDRQLAAPQALGLGELPTEPVDSSIPGGDDPDQIAFRGALAAGDEASCQQILRRRVARGQSRSEAAESLITDAMRGIGQAWNQQKVDVYQERRGCEISIRLINGLRAELPAIAPSAPVAIGGSLSGDPYQLPTALVELSLREIGWNAISLGSNLPADSILRAINEYRPTLVWLSVSTFDDAEEFIAEQNRLAAGLGEEVSLLLGGRALTDEIRPSLRYTAHCDSLRSLVNFAGMIRLHAVPAV